MRYVFMKRLLTVFLLVLCVSCDFNNKDDTTEFVPPLNIEAKVYAIDDTTGGTFDGTLNVESVTVKINGHELDTKGKIENGVLSINVPSVPSAWLVSGNLQKDLPPGFVVSSTSSNVRAGMLELSFLRNEGDYNPPRIFYPRVTGEAEEEIITILYSDRDVEIRQSGTAEVSIEPGQTVMLTVDIVLDIHKGWNFITDKTDYNFDSTPQSMSVTQRAFDKIPETAKWYYF
jgi:hypothetical protein